MIPMRLTEIEVTTLENYVNDPQWWVQQKMDGARALFVWERTVLPTAPEHPGGDPGDEEQTGWTWLSSKGTPLKFAAAALHLEAIAQELDALLTDSIWDYVVIDGEVIPEQGLFHVFDLPYLTEGPYGPIGRYEQVRPDNYFWHRFTHLSYLMEYGEDRLTRTRMVPLAATSTSKVTLVEKVRESGAEGLVLRHVKGTWDQGGGRSKTALKAKFVKTADVVVMDWKRGTTASGNPSGSADFGVYTNEGLTRLGSCSLIGKPDVEVGDVIEVAYLYRQPGGGLLQPRMIRVREDKEPRDCTVDQFPVYSRAAVDW